MTFRHLFFLLLGIVYLSSGTLGISRQSNIVFQNNGYSNIVIAMHESIPDSQNFIRKTKDAFTAASKMLYRSTRKRAFFKDIKILVPSKWSDNPAYQPATTETINNADVIVTGVTTTRRSAATSRSYSGCGRQGMHILMTGGSIVNPRAAPVSGFIDKFIVQQWANFRWGVFQEYPSPGESQFYFSTVWGRPDAVQCTNLLRGRALRTYPNGTKAICLYTHIDPTTGLLPEGCYYTAYPFGNRGTTASLMNHHYIREIVDFCDDGPAYGTKHNPEPLTRQNRLCSHRSTFDVISNTPDFVGDINPPRDIQNVTPSFTILKAPRIKRSALLVDQNTLNSIHKMKVLQSMALYLHASRAEDHAIIVPNHADVTGRSRVIRSTDNQLSSAQHLLAPVNISKITLNDVKQMFLLDDLDDTYVTKRVIIFGDCKTPLRKSLLEDMEREGFSAHVMYFGHAETLSKDRHKYESNRVYFDHDHPSATAHADIIYNILNKEQESHHTVQLLSRSYVVQHNLDVNDTFSVDSSIRSGQMLVIASHNKTEIPTITLESPTGVIYNSTSNRYLTDSSLKTIKINVDQREQNDGQWSLRIGSAKYQRVSVSVLYRNVPTMDMPIELKAKIMFLDNMESDAPVVGIYADVTQGHGPVTGLNVTAKIFRTDSGSVQPFTMKLRDNGAGADISEHDGIYSRYFTHFAGPGRYSLKVEIRHEDNILGDAMGELSRVVYGGHIIVPHDIEHKYWVHHDNKRASDVYPPSRVADLLIKEKDEIDSTVTLQWTAPGDDMDTGTVHHYDIRYGNNGVKLLDDTKTTEEGVLSADRVPWQAIMPSSDLFPSTCGNIEVVKINMSLLPVSKNVGYAFILRAYDHENNPSEFSNMVTVGFERRPPRNNHYLPQSTSHFVFTGKNIFQVSLLIVFMVCCFIVVIVHCKYKNYTYDVIYKRVP